MIDPDNEELISLSRAANLPCLQVNGKGVAQSTLWRYVTVGLCSPAGERIKLESIWTGGRRATSEAAVHRFLNRLNGVESQPPKPSARRMEEVRRTLEQHGVKWTPRESPKK